MEKFEDRGKILALSSGIGQYAEEKHLENTARALPLVLGIMMNGDATNRYQEAKELVFDAHHALETCRMLVDLHLDIPREEEDILLTSALCRMIPQTFHMEDIEKELAEKYNLHPEVCRLVSIVHRRNDLTHSEFKKRIKRVQENKLALLIVLSSRGNIIEHISEISLWNAQSYIHETRSYYFPMCIYGKEKYPDILPALNLLYEKMKSLLEAAEILISRYVAREYELTSEILALKEENAILKNRIVMVKARKK